MILNDFELNLSITSCRDLQEVLVSLESDESILAQLQRDSIEHQILDLESEIESYNRLKIGTFIQKDEVVVSSLPDYLIRARIAQNFSQRDVSEFLEIHIDKFKALESSYYSGVNLSRVIKISQFLNLDIKKITDDIGETLFTVDPSSIVDWNEFPAKEMNRRGWLNKEGNNSLVNAVKDFIGSAFGPALSPALHRKASFAKKSAHDASLVAWQAKVLVDAEHLLTIEAFPEFKLNDTWIPKLVRLSKESDGPLRAKALLKEHGIVLIIEPHLPKTYLDGAAMLSESGNPVIGMTLRHDRLDNFWFVLLHELGHVYLHLSELGRVFVDEKVGDETIGVEKEADIYALNSLIPEDIWSKSLSRIMPSERTIIGEAKTLGISPAIIAGRIRQEKADFTKFGKLIGNKEVRKLFNVS